MTFVSEFNPFFALLLPGRYLRGDGAFRHHLVEFVLIDDVDVVFCFLSSRSDVSFLTSGNGPRFVPSVRLAI